MSKNANASKTRIRENHVYGRLISLIPYVPHPFVCPYLYLGGEAAEEDGLTDGVGHLSLGCLVDVFAKDKVRAVLLLDPVLVEPLDPVRIVHPLERLLRRHERRVQLAHQRAVRTAQNT